VIQSFDDRPSERFFLAGRLEKGVGWRSCSDVVRRKLDMLHYAAQLGDLKSPPGNRLEALTGNLSGLHGLRVNDRWRIVFRWTDRGPSEVRVMDYH